jgi:Flp pilus assembly protein TadB
MQSDPDLPPPPESIWMHGLVMLVLVILVNLAQTVLGICAVVQFFWMLIARERNAGLARFGRGLANWLAVTARFLTAGSDARPFPWADWDSR